MTQTEKEAPVFVPFVWNTHVVLNEGTKSTISALSAALAVDDDGKPVDQKAYDATIGLLQASGGIAPATLSVAGDGFNTVRRAYSEAWKKHAGNEQFSVYLDRLNEFTSERRKAYGLAYLALPDRDDDGLLRLHGQATKAPTAKSWAVSEMTSPITTIHYRPAVLDDDGEVKVKAGWDYEIVEVNAEAVEEFDLIEGGYQIAMSSLVSFLTEREDSAIVVDLIKRARLVKDGFVIEAPAPVAVQRTVRVGRGQKYVATITLLNGTIVKDITGSSAQVGLACAKAALEADPSQAISNTDKFYNPTGKNPDIPRGYAGSWIGGALKHLAEGKSYTRPWLKDVQINTV